MNQSLFFLFALSLFTLGTSMAGQQCRIIGDVIFLLDESGSIEAKNWPIVKKMVAHAVQEFPVDSDKEMVRIGVVSFSSAARVRIPFMDYSDKSDLLTKVNNLPYATGGTNLGVGLRKAFDEMKKSITSKQRTGVPAKNIPRIIFIFGDGEANAGLTSVSQLSALARSMADGTHSSDIPYPVGIFTVFIDKSKQLKGKQVFEGMASKPLSKWHEYIESFDKVDLNRLVAKFCEAAEIEANKKLPKDVTLHDRTICKEANKFLLFDFQGGLDPVTCHDYLLANTFKCPSLFYQITLDTAQKWKGCKCCEDTTLIKHNGYKVYEVKKTGASVQTCTDTPGWTNPSGRNCQNDYKYWCENGTFKKGLEWTAGTAQNNPEKNCCDCGKASGKAQQWMSCKDSPAGWNKNDWRKCADYAKEGICADGVLKDSKYDSSWFNYPNKNCCICGKYKTSPVLSPSSSSQNQMKIAGGLLFLTFLGVLGFYKSRKSNEYESVTQVEA